MYYNDSNTRTDQVQYAIKFSTFNRYIITYDQFWQQRKCQVQQESKICNVKCKYCNTLNRTMYSVICYLYYLCMHTNT